MEDNQSLLIVLIVLAIFFLLGMFGGGSMGTCTKTLTAAGTGVVGFASVISLLLNLLFAIVLILLVLWLFRRLQEKKSSLRKRK